MGQSNNYSAASATGSGEKVEVTYNWEVDEVDDLRVAAVRDSDGELKTNADIERTCGDGAVEVTYPFSGEPKLWTAYVYRVTDLTQEYDLTQGALDSTALVGAHDRIVRMVQEVAERLNRESSVGVMLDEHDPRPMKDHTVASHSDTSATGAELNELVGSGDTSLHDHDGISENTAHRASDGSDHTFLDQDVTSGSSPVLDAANITGLPSSGLAAGVGIANDNIVEVDDADAADNDYAKFTANGLEGRSYAEVADDIEGSIDHGNLQGLSTGADHSYIDQDVTSGSSPTLDGTNITGIPNGGLDETYVNADGSVGLSADWDIGDGRKIEADEIRARDGDGLGLYDDGGNGIFVEDGGMVQINGESVENADENKTTVYLKDGTSNYLIQQTEVWNGSSWVTGDCWGFGESVLENNTGQYATASGYYSAQNNTGDGLTATGYYSAQNNSGNYLTATGMYSVQNNSGHNATASGYYSAQNNSGNNLTASGYGSAYNNSGSYLTASGMFSALNNSGSYVTASGYQSACDNSGDDSLGLGKSTLRYNEGDDNIAIGHEAWADFHADFGSAKTFAHGDVSVANDTITINGHGFGTGIIHVQYAEGTEAIGGLTDGTIYMVKIVDANTIGFNESDLPDGTSITSTGSGTGHSLTPQHGYANSIVIGAGVEPTASNQVTLGNSSITETLLQGNVRLSADNAKLTLGAGDDASIYYDGTGFVFDSQEVGSGNFHFLNGPLRVDGESVTNTDENKTTVYLKDGTSNYLIQQTEVWDGDSWETGDCWGFGESVLENNTGQYVTASGYQSAQNNTGNYVTATGYYSARDNSGYGVTASGHASAYNNSGSYVTASGFYSARSNSGGRVTASGNFSAENNSGDNVTASGYYSAYNNSGHNVTASGYQSAQNNTGYGVTASGMFSALNNSGSYVTASGYQSAYNNSGHNVTASGFRSAMYNLGYGVTATGHHSAENNTGGNVTAIGVYSARYNEGDNNIAIGHEAWADFHADSGSAQTFAHGDVSVANDTVTINSHGFGTGIIHVQYAEGTDPIGGLTDGNIYMVKVVDANTIGFNESDLPSGTNITSTGSGTGHELTPQHGYANSIVIGAGAEPTASNQVTLGNSSITETLLQGDVKMSADNAKLTLGAGDDCEQYYDGSDWIVDTDAVGTGSAKINGLEIDKDGYLKPVTSTESSAPNNSIFFNSDDSVLSYKDSGGSVHNLY